ncbi:hypothetical protein T4B_10723 [Trichinella pseudospiralis]|uniref:Uncharacterized protein n=1 Tax=Trichinella pseudospiralis TaxID=6337 RepID=A0A0V1G9Y8_TRIPS|nr:hypothetical protein T4B_10723 [Trichinella pseudospiralis]
MFFGPYYFSYCSHSVLDLFITVISKVVLKL